MLSIPVICFVGASNSGKTTLIEKVIRLLADRDYRIATVKHTHKGFEMDTEGKDSWRHRSAGAKTVILLSPTQYVVVSETDREFTIEDVVERFIQGIDILIVEGFKRDRYPKIEVYRRGVSKELRCLNDPTVVALVSDDFCDVEIPGFDINDAKGVTDFIEEIFLVTKRGEGVDLKPEISRPTIGDTLRAPSGARLNFKKGREKKMIKVAVLTMSDKGSRGERVDESGRLVCEMVKDIAGEVVTHEIIPDEQKIIEERLKHFADDMEVDLVVTTGGTGVSPRDVTPEATKNVIEKEIPGLAEVMRIEGCKKTIRAAISRGIVGIRRGSLIVNLPGSPKGVMESLSVVLSTIPHVLEKMHGEEAECGQPVK